MRWPSPSPLFSEELDVRLITTVAGNVSLDKVTYNTLRILKFFKKEVPVARGAAEPLILPLLDASNVHGKSGMEGSILKSRTTICCCRNTRWTPCGG